MVPFPYIGQRFVDAAGKILQPLISYLQQFTIAPPPFLNIIADGSPFEYEAKEPGVLFISGGTVTDISLTRGADTIIVAPNTANPRLIPVGIMDIVTVTYVVIPTIKFIPSYGQNTTS